MGGGQSSGGGSQTVSQTNELPAYAQDFAKQNLSIAQDVASRPYQPYQGDMVAPLTDLQNQGLGMTQTAANAQQPYFDQANNMITQAANPWNAQTAQQWMSPYTMQALQPQIQQLQLQQAQNQLGINKGATQAGAFGDARHGVAQGLNNFYGNLSMNDLVGQGMNAAYTTGMQGYQNQQGQLLNAGGQMGNLGTAAQTAGLAGANAVFGAGTQQQQLNQQQLNAAYQNYQNSQNWAPEMLNIRSAAVQNNPYSTTRLTSAPSPNATASNIGLFSTLAGGLGGLLGGK